MVQAITIVFGWLSTCSIYLLGVLLAVLTHYITCKLGLFDSVIVWLCVVLMAGLRLVLVMFTMLFVGE